MLESKLKSVKNNAEETSVKGNGVSFEEAQRRGMNKLEWVIGTGLEREVLTYDQFIERVLNNPFTMLEPIETVLPLGFLYTHEGDPVAYYQPTEQTEGDVIYTSLGDPTLQLPLQGILMDQHSIPIFLESSNEVYEKMFTPVKKEEGQYTFEHDTFVIFQKTGEKGFFPKGCTVPISMLADGDVIGAKSLEEVNEVYVHMQAVRKEMEKDPLLAALTAILSSKRRDGK